MQSNLVLTATFADTQKPVLSLTTPTSGQRWSNALFTVTGKVSDNGPGGVVWYQLNGGAWGSATGWSNWSANVTLNPGTNLISAYAQDTAGNRSPTNSAVCTYVLTAPITVTVIGNGTVSGVTNGQRLELGKTVTLTANPGTGYVLTNWLVQVGGVTVLSTNKVTPFAMQSNLVLTATFATDGSAEQQSIRAFYALLKARGEAHDAAGFAALFDANYVHMGQVGVPSDLADRLSVIRTFNFTITNIVISGDTAKAFGTCNLALNNGEPPQIWAEPDTIDQSPGFGWLRRTATGWKVYGNQQHAVVHLATGHNEGGGNYFFRVRTESPQTITSVTFRGPGVSATSLDPDYQFGGFTAFIRNLPNPLPAVGTEYDFIIDFRDGTREILHDTVKAWVQKGPTFTVSPGRGTATVRWTQVSASVPNASYYWVRISGQGVYWESDELPLSRTSAVFNENGQAQGTLQNGWGYDVEVFIFNKSGDYAYSIDGMVMPNSGSVLASIGSVNPPVDEVAARQIEGVESTPAEPVGGRAGAVIVNGLLQVRLVGPVGPVVVEACTNLAQPFWTPVGTNTVMGGPIWFTDPLWTNYPTRFYRLRTP